MNSVLQVFKPAQGWKLLGLFRGEEKGQCVFLLPSSPSPSSPFPFTLGDPYKRPVSRDKRE